MIRTLLTAAGLAAFALCSPVQAEEGGASPQMQRALAAGYKAAFTCAATFNAGRTPQEIAASELDLIYPDYREVFAALPDAEIDRTAMRVSAPWDDVLPPRIAVYRPGFGCTQLPIGAPREMAETLPAAAHALTGDLPPDRDPCISPDAPKSPPAEDTGRLSQLTAKAFDGRSFGEGSRTSAILIVQNGHVLAEQYDRGIDQETSQRTWSVAKSISATVMGAAVERGLIDIDDPAALETWQAPGDPRAGVTVRHLLNMASGLDSGRRGSRTDRLYFGGGRVIDHAEGRDLEAAPGTRFKYANNDTLLAMRALRERMDDDAAYHALPYEAVLRPIGAMRTVLETDWNADVLSSSQVWTTARDLARIGQLYLQDGVWNAERLLAEGWAAFVSTPAPAQPAGGDWGYGGQFWLVGGVEGLPEDAYAAAGHRGQYIVIVPSRNAVIVRRGFDESGGRGFDIARFAADALKVLARERK